MVSVTSPSSSPSVRIVDGVLYFDAYEVTENGSERVDSFAIQKDKTQGDVAEGYVPPADDTADTGTDTLKKIVDVIVKILTVLMNIAKWYIF